MRSKEIQFGDCSAEQKDALLSEVESAAYAALCAAATMAERANASAVLNNVMQCRKTLEAKLTATAQSRDLSAGLLLKEVLMSHRAAPSGITLSVADAALVKGMLKRGDRQHDIAAWFGVNGGRVGEIASGRRFYEIEAAPLEALPPVGPYPKPREAVAAIAALTTARRALGMAEEALGVMARH